MSSACVSLNMYQCHVYVGLFEWEWFAKQQDEQMNPAVAEDDFAPDGITAFSQLSHSTSKNNLHRYGTRNRSIPFSLYSVLAHVLIIVC